MAAWKEGGVEGQSVGVEVLGVAWEVSGRGGAQGGACSAHLQMPRRHPLAPAPPPRQPPLHPGLLFGSGRRLHPRCGRCVMTGLGWHCRRQKALTILDLMSPLMLALPIDVQSFTCRHRLGLPQRPQREAVWKPVSHVCLKRYRPGSWS